MTNNKDLKEQYLVALEVYKEQLAQFYIEYIAHYQKGDDDLTQEVHSTNPPIPPPPPPPPPGDE